MVAYSIARDVARFSKGSGIVAKFLTHKPVNFASLTYSFIACIIFKIIIKTLIFTANTTNIKRLSGPEKFRDFRETGPWANTPGLT